MSADCVVIVPFYNRRHTILRTLASVQAQTVRPKRVILVDDGSSDDGAQLVRQWMAGLGGHLECHLIQQSNAGPAAARNHGLARAGQSKFVAFLDSDDIWPADFLERAQDTLSGDDRAVAASCDRKLVYCDGTPPKVQDSSVLAERAALWMLENGAGIASATLFRRAAIDRRGGFDPQLISGEDTALFLPLSLDGRWLHVPGKPVEFHRGLAEQLGDEGNLSLKFNYRRRVWAQIYEDFVLDAAGNADLETPQCRRLLARMWYLAGRELLYDRSPRAALDCFRKSLAWDPWRWRCHLLRVGAWLATLGQASGLIDFTS